MTAMEEPVRPAPTLIAIDDDPDSLELIREALAGCGADIYCYNDSTEGYEAVVSKRPDIVLLDLVMPGASGMDILERIIQRDAAVDVILMTGHYSTESAVEAIQKGACDYLNKPVNVGDLRKRVEKLVQDAKRRVAAARVEKELLDVNRFQGMVGRSPLMLDIFARIRRVAPHFNTALITGATGTGKELAAQALHRLSPAAQAPFVVVNCSAVVETLFESELFGHAKGAFTGAQSDRTGLIEHADGGTLFLDELGDMPLSTQSKLLRALQSKEIRRVGSNATKTVDVRVIAATNRDLPKRIAAGQFREDLYYRLSMVEIKLPTLSERKEDLSLLVRHFLDFYGAQYHKVFRGVSPRASATLERYPWPGNVRELENVMGIACMMADGPTIDVHDLPEQIRNVPAPAPGTDDEPIIPLHEVERRYARHVLKQLGGNKFRTAVMLGISRATLYRLLDDPSSAPVPEVIAGGSPKRPAV